VSVLLHRRASPDVALRLVAPGGCEVRWGLVALRLVEQLEDVAVRVGEAVGGPVPDVALCPPGAEPCRLDGGHATIESIGAPGAQCDVPQTCSRGLGQFQGI